MEHIELDNDENKEDQDVTGAAASSEIPTKKSEAGDNTSIHSRENQEAGREEKKTQKKSLERDEEDMESQNSDEMMNKWML